MLNKIRWRISLQSISRTLRSHPEIGAFQVPDQSGTGLFWFKFELKEKFVKEFRGVRTDTPVFGLGMGFTEELSIIRAWSEFLERYSFYLEAAAMEAEHTTNGYAGHTSRRLARLASIAELIERDVLLSSWLLRLPASRLSAQEFSSQHQVLDRLEQLRRLGAEIEFGVLGICSGLTVGVAFVSKARRFAILTTAKRRDSDVLEHLTTQAAAAVAGFDSPSAPTPIESMSDEAWPIDHYRLYLEGGMDTILPWFLGDNPHPREFPPVAIETRDLTSANRFAQKTGFSVFRAQSDSCQDLWIGPTRKEVVNLGRLAAICGKRVHFEELNPMPHPLP